MAAAVRAGALRRTNLRKNAKQKHEAGMKRAQLLMAKYDTNKSGQLERSQMVALLTAYNFGTPVETAVVDDIMSNYADTSTDSLGITAHKINSAITSWRAYMKDFRFIEARLRKYDASKTGDLKRDEVKNMMTEMNKGTAPTDDDVDFVMERGDESKTGTISPNEMRRACALWKEIIAEQKAHSAVCLLL